MTKLQFVLVFATLLFSLAATAQKGEIMEHREDKLTGFRGKNNDVNILVGNVEFTQTTTKITCDSARLYRKQNSMEAFGNVRIQNFEDSTIITSDWVRYDGNGRVARLRDNVVYRDDSIVLYTDYLDYDMIDKSANYFNGGRIEDGTNVLSSGEGRYDTEGKMMKFYKQVKLINPDYTLESEDLVYNINTKIAIITSANTITASDGSVLHAEIGSEFNTDLETSEFLDSEIETESYYIKGKRLYADNLAQVYTASGKVYMRAKDEDVILTSDEAIHNRRTKVTKLFGNPVMKKIFGNDTLYLSADTLVSIDDTLESNKRLLCFHNVKIFKNDMQGIADSLAYMFTDSTIHLYQDPVIWNEVSQISSDSIYLKLTNNTLDKLFAKRNVFIISQDSAGNYNQVKGREMEASFLESVIEKINVNGNGESIYYALEEGSTKLMGLNSITSSSIIMLFVNNQPGKVKFVGNIGGKFIPPHEIKEKDRFLENFRWRGQEKPTLDMILGTSVQIEPEVNTDADTEDNLVVDEDEKLIKEPGMLKPE